MIFRPKVQARGLELGPCRLTPELSPAGHGVSLLLLAHRDCVVAEWRWREAALLRHFQSEEQPDKGFSCSEAIGKACRYTNEVAEFGDRGHRPDPQHRPLDVLRGGACAGSRANCPGAE